MSETDKIKLYQAAFTSLSRLFNLGGNFRLPPKFSIGKLGGNSKLPPNTAGTTSSRST